MSDVQEENTSRLERAGHVDLSDPVFQALLAELGLLALIIFLLAWPMRLLGYRSNSPE